MPANAPTVGSKERQLQQHYRPQDDQELFETLSNAAAFESIDGLREAEIGHLRQSEALGTDVVQKTHDPNHLMVAALVFARTGNTKQSQDLLEKVNQLLPNDFAIQAFNLPATRATIKLDENDPAAAIEILRSVTPYDLAISDSFDTVYPAYLRGIAYLQLKEGNLAAAARTLSRCTSKASCPNWVQTIAHTP